MKASKKIQVTASGKMYNPLSDNNTQTKLIASIADDVKIAIKEDCAIHNKNLPEPDYIVELVNLIMELIYDNYKFGGK